MAHESFDPSQAAVFNEFSHKKDNTFEVCYFAIHGFATVTCPILAAAGAKLTNISPDDKWQKEKAKAPFGEISADGKTALQAAEPDSIGRYLARKFGFYSSNLFEETAINTFVSQGASGGEQVLIEGSIITWIIYNEQHLKDNGSNGHFVDDKLTYADFKAYFLIYALEFITAKKDLILHEKTLAIWKVKEAVDLDPSAKA
ncbi:hypothetical protein BX616_002732 [Lobosporangium transversale]|uniref:Glutathione S-transferase C-terminal domain-containing protein n=1 Tax=Lobosporangium transversale TaxID=64571 RepID=A0A1Y2GAN0_9FUNG|nr:hypothetical protein BCR41DRAFT_375142 [Lobosporangium transversale]KAF9900028.1 hypothetical protein BX616_002732 [Lobosporangium transversale]ORZ02058.1 hypothetical protein BCR41DRAFT_375142 [Lobosporangium transversale]|eukprot:XP_021876286.1 hypothetical protein BCR41DRAFT_375142 [Lobosporangium transversale]